MDMTQGLDVTISPINLPWILVAVAFLLLCIPIYLWLRHKSYDQKRRMLLKLAMANLILFVVYLFVFQRSPGLDFLRWDMLPIDLCNLLTLFFVVALMTDSPRLYCFCFYVGIAAGLAAILSPEGGLKEMQLFSPMMIGFYFVHCMLYTLGISLVTLELYTPSVKDAFLSVLYLEILTLGIYGINLLLRHTVYPTANLFFLFDAGQSAYLEALHSVVPIPPFTLMVSVLPIAIGTFLLLTLMYHIGKKIAQK